MDQPQRPDYLATRTQHSMALELFARDYYASVEEAETVARPVSRP